MQPPALPSPVLRVVPPVLLTVPEAAARLRVSRATVYRLCAEGHLEHVRISNHAIRIKESAIASYLACAG
jgi:excisionase family DNA binding protein